VAVVAVVYQGLVELVVLAVVETAPLMLLLLEAGQ
jgi:hypothetical protein